LGRQTDRQTGKQADRQNRRIGRHADKQVGVQTDRHAGRCADRQTRRLADRQIDWQIVKNKQVYRWRRTGRFAGREKQTGLQRRTNRLGDSEK